MYLGTCIEIYYALLVSLAKHNTLPFVEIDIFSIQLDQFAYTHTCRSQQVYDGKVAFFNTVVTQMF